MSHNCQLLCSIFRSRDSFCQNIILPDYFAVYLDKSSEIETYVLFQCQEGSLYLPPPVEDPEIDVITSTVRILPIGRTGDGTDEVDIDAEFPDHHHGHDDDDPLGWLRESIPGISYL